MQGRTEKADVTNRTHLPTTATDCRGPVSNLQAESGGSCSPSSLPSDRLLHLVRDSRVNYRAFDKAHLDRSSFLLGRLRNLDARRISLPPLCFAWPFSARQRHRPPISARAARSSPLGSSHAAIRWNAYQ